MTGVLLAKVPDAVFAVAVSLVFLAVRTVRIAGLTSPFVVGFFAPAEERCVGLTSPFVRGFFSAELDCFAAETLGLAVVAVVDAFGAATGVVFVGASLAASGLDVNVLVVGVEGFLAPVSYKNVMQ